MNRFLRKPAVKIVALFLFVLLTALSLIGCFGSVYMAYADFFTASVDEIAGDFYVNTTYKNAQTAITECFLFGNPPELFFEKTNFRFVIYDGQGEEVLRYYEGEPYEFTLDTFYFESDYKSMSGGAGEQEYTISCYVLEGLPQTDRYAITAYYLELVYRYRFLILLLTLVVLIADLAILAVMMSAAGRRPGSERVHQTLIDRIPFDLFCTLYAALVLLQLWLIVELWSSLLLLLMIPIGFVDILLAALFLLSTATRYKAGELFRNTLIRRFFSLIGRLVRAVPQRPRATLIFLAAAAADLILTSFLLVDPMRLFLFLVVEKVVLLSFLLGFETHLLTLKGATERIADGELSHTVDAARLPAGFRECGENLNRISDGMTRVVDERIMSERFRAELITNVSHDIKTPLTSIINYIDLIKKEEPTEEPLCSYVEVLDRQSARLKKLIYDLIEASKVSTGNVEVEPVPCELGVLLAQAMGEYEERFRAADLTSVLTLPDESVRVMADNNLLWRCFDNLFRNIEKYSQPHTRVYITLHAEDELACLTLKNISGTPLSADGEALLERFVRGDSSRNTEGSGLGLSITRDLIALQKGRIEIAVDGDLFKVTITFAKLAE